MHIESVAVEGDQVTVTVAEMVPKSALAGLSAAAKRAVVARKVLADLGGSALVGSLAAVADPRKSRIKAVLDLCVACAGRDKAAGQAALAAMVSGSVVTAAEATAMGTYLVERLG